MRHINSTSVGGGVAEILTRMIPLLRDLGVDARWDVIKGDQAFYNVTKAFHNALHGKPEQITEEMFEIFRATTEMNLREVDLDSDLIVIHDPQPAGLIERKKEDRAALDLALPHRRFQPAAGRLELLAALGGAIRCRGVLHARFLAAVADPQFRVAPSIDPLADKNKPLDKGYVLQVLEKYGIDPGKPMLVQISRYDRLKDPLGVIAAYKLVKKRHRCQLVLAGGGATDDPEGEKVLSEVREAAEGDPDIHVLLLPPFSDLEINALVRASTVAIQKSLREGFGLTVSEAMWKKKPVIGGAVGGIKLQVIDGVTGYLVHSPEGCANRIAQLLRDRRLRERLGENGHQHVRQNFLVTRQVKDALLATLALDHPGESVVNLGRGARFIASETARNVKRRARRAHTISKG